MLNTQSLEAIAKVLNTSADDLKAKITSEQEEALEVPKLFTETDLNTAKTIRFEDGKKAATEILVKDLKEKHGVEMDGKDVNVFIDKFAAKVKSEVSTDPTEREKQLKKDLEKVQSVLTTERESFSSEKIRLQSQLKREQHNRELLGLIPENTVIPKSDVLTIFNSEFSIEEEEGKKVVKKSGEILKKDTAEPFTVQEIVANFIDSRKLVTKGVRKEGDDDGEGGAKTFKTTQDFMAYCQKNNIEPTGPKGMEILMKSRENPEFDRS